MTKKYILIVGGAGYIGAHVSKFLSKSGFIPVVYDNFTCGHRENVKWGPLEEGCAGDKEKLNHVFRKYPIAAVMHFAAYAYVGESVIDPQKYYQNNVSETLALLNGMLDNGIKHFIFSSSCTIYGIPDKIPIDEECSKSPINPYGYTKLMVEQILSDYDHAYGLKSACLRYFNAAGADPECEIGENHCPETHLIPNILAAAIDGKTCVDLYGNDYPTPDGTCIRDYIHVTDLAQAHWLALDFLQTQKKSLQVNLGNGKGYSNMEIIDTVRKVTGRDIKVRYVARREGDPPILVGNPEKAISVLGWNPKYASLESIIETAWKWAQASTGNAIKKNDI